ncbi:hypothetical protein [Chitinophaga barathri]|uniref:DUF4293 family protein n=1 Tax=Chitinophaga barathri TaxID=1647451 RepID=A0A3N4MLT6_9BACT|nr:hypothetical protein [Chitinophaga barathri]RPD43026.1 hypothetical protein EG028_01680 [Chitinophaga barathri]
MNKLLQKIAPLGLILLLGCLLLFHFAVISGMLPFDMIWGGQLQTQAQMIRQEIIAIAFILVFLIVALCKAELLPVKAPVRMINVLLWIMAVFFLLNSVANILSENNLERLIFTPISLLLFIFCVILARGNAARKNKISPGNTTQAPL